MKMVVRFLQHLFCLSCDWKHVAKCLVYAFRSLAEVNTLSSDDGPLRWVPVVESVMPIVIHKKKVIHVINYFMNVDLSFFETIMV